MWIYLESFLHSPTTFSPPPPPPCAPDPRPPRGVCSRLWWCCARLVLLQPRPQPPSQARARHCANMLPFLIQTVRKALGQNILSPWAAPNKLSFHRRARQILPSLSPHRPPRPSLHSFSLSLHALELPLSQFLCSLWFSETGTLTLPLNKLQGCQGRRSVGAREPLEKGVMERRRRRRQLEGRVTR